jgi:hypothetical protein
MTLEPGDPPLVAGKGERTFAQGETFQHSAGPWQRFEGGLSACEEVGGVIA